jgi:putative endonuclease
MTITSDEPNNRRQAWTKGQVAERFAALALVLKGYRILARQYRTPVGEVDIVAKRGNCLIFVEVKARATERMARESIGTRQQERIARAAEIFVQRHRNHAESDCRFDAVLVLPWRWPHHLENAWQN